MTSTIKTTPKMEICNIEGCIVYYQKYLLKTPQLDGNSRGDPNWKFNRLSKPEIEFDVMKEMYATLRM